MTEQKFKTGDQIRIIKYGAKIYQCKKDYKESYAALSKMLYESEHFLMYGKEPDTYPEFEGKDRPNHIIEETDDIFVVDMCPEVVGQTATIVGSYHDLYSSPTDSPQVIAKNKQSYSLLNIKGKSAWYQEEQLELITP